MKQKYIVEVLDTNSDIIRHTFNIPKAIYSNGDYLHQIFIKIKLPAIYSSNERQFKWIKYLGYNIINKVVCNLRFKNSKNENIDIKLYTYTEWLYIWYEINLSEKEKELHYELIGNTLDLYEPESYYKNNGSYPVSHLKKQKYKWIIDNNNNQKAHPQAIITDNNFNRPPSIPSKILYIPLNFYFCDNIKNALPLHIFDKLDFEITLNNINKLYTILLNIEDFVVDISTNAPTRTNVNNVNYYSNVILDSNIKFVNNDNYSFSSNVHYTDPNPNKLSMFDVITNKYRIIPLNYGTTAINNFIINKIITNFNDNLNVTNIISKNDFYQKFCDTHIIFNIISQKKFTDTSLNISGLLSEYANNQLLFDINPIGSDKLIGSAKDANLSMNVINSNKNIDIFFIIRHNQRLIKNDALNFTNLDFNMSIPWNNTLSNSNNSYNEDIEIFNGSLWEHHGNNKSIKIGIDELGTFFIKKQILDNNIFKYINILEYKSSNNTTTNTSNSRWNSLSQSIFSENIIDECLIKINLRNKKLNINEIISFSDNKESYNFYNKITTLSKYKNTIPGLYYINNSYNNIKQIELLQTSANKINIDNDNSYNYLVFCNSTKTISI